MTNETLKSKVRDAWLQCYPLNPLHVHAAVDQFPHVYLAEDSFGNKVFLKTKKSRKGPVTRLKETLGFRRELEVLRILGLAKVEYLEVPQVLLTIESDYFIQ